MSTIHGSYYLLWLLFTVITIHSFTVIIILVILVIIVVTVIYHLPALQILLSVIIFSFTTAIPV